MSENGRQSAFPTQEKLEVPDEFTGKYREILYPSGGLTKRELIAAMAMQGILSNITKITGDWTGQLTPGFMSAQAVKLTDALLEELEKPCQN